MSIDITPLGYKVPGGPERIAKATEALADSQAKVANETHRLLRARLITIIRALRFASRDVLEDEDIISELRDLEHFAAEMYDCQEEFLRAVAGAPPK